MEAVRYPMNWFLPLQAEVCETRRCGEELTALDVFASEQLSKRLGIAVRLCRDCLIQQEEIHQAFGEE